MPTGNDAKLFKQFLNHYEEHAYLQFLQLRRHKPETRVAELQDQLLEIQDELRGIINICKEADSVIVELEAEYHANASRLHELVQTRARREFEPEAEAQADGAADAPEPAFDQQSKGTRSLSRKRSLSKPPQLPLLPFQVESDITTEPTTVATPKTVLLATSEKVSPVAPKIAPQRRDSTLKKSFSAIERERPYKHLLTEARTISNADDPIPIPRPLRIRKPQSQITPAKSFSAAEEQLNQGGHFRSATNASEVYTAQPPGPIGLGITHLPRHESQQATTGLRRKCSSSDIPRVFTGSLEDLEDKVYQYRLHKIKTPEHPPTAGVGGVGAARFPDELLPDDCPRVRDFAAPVADHSKCPSPRALQRREALVSRDAQFEDRVVKGEVVRSRRPEAVQRAVTITGGAEGLSEAWMKQQLAATESSPNRPGSAGRRRENTL